MKEVKEIERRFLMMKLPKFPVQWDKIYSIRQLYIQDGDLVKRIRLKTDLTDWSNIHDSFEYLHKIQKGIGEYVEMHEDIDQLKFEELSNKAFKGLYKQRYVHFENGFHFEFDQISNTNLTLLEVELEDINQEIIFPQKIKDLIIMEVTGIKELSNFALATKLEHVNQ